MSGERGIIIYEGITIPGHWYRTPWRFVATEYGWKKMVRYARRNQGCAVQTSQCIGTVSTLHHNGGHGRGMGGGKRDDRQVVPICASCHQVEEEKRREG